MRQKSIQWCNDSNRRLKTGKLNSLRWTSLPLCVTLMRGTVKRSDLSYEFTNFAHKVESWHCVNVDSKDQRHRHTMCEVRLRQMKTHHFLFTFNEAPVVFRCCWSPKNRTWSTFGVHHHIVAASHALPVNYTAQCLTVGPVMLMKWDSLHCTTATQPCRECRPVSLLKKERKKWCSREVNLWPFDHYYIKCDLYPYVGCTQNSTLYLHM